VSEIRDWRLVLDKERYGDFNGRRAELIIVHGTREQAEELKGDLDFVEAGCTDLYFFEGES
jgi:hypothetical protein